MSQPIELTAEQLSALDEIIAQKKEGKAEVAAKIPHLIVITPIATVVWAKTPVETMNEASVKELVKNTPVEKLIEARKKAIQKG